ncbi:MAG: pyridoxal phosphate-dependent aminotransferase, partial [Sulfitobacter sp.]|nr:pyridoxal phosphate-dependent aminotransferase [Sulfitobacter sp.]
VIAEIALRPERLAPAMEKARREGEANLDHMKKWVTKQEGLSWVAPRAGLIGLGRLPDGIDSDAFARRLLADPYRTFLLPGSAYDQPNHIRLGVGGGAEVNLDEGLNRLAQALKDWPQG